MMSTVDAWTLAASHAIRNVLAIHSRGVDRGDGNLLGAAYHADATVDYGFFAGEASTLVSILAGAQAAAPPTMHRTAGSDIRVSGAQAVAESYVIAAIEIGERTREGQALGRRGGQLQLETLCFGPARIGD